MPSIPVKLGDPLPLSLTLFDGATGLYPQAHVYGSDGSEDGSSPFDLAHLALGRYTNIAFTPSVVDVLTALFITYTDAGHVNESSLYDRIEESYAVNALQSTADAIKVKTDALPTNVYVWESEPS